MCVDVSKYQKCIILVVMLVQTFSSHSRVSEETASATAMILVPDKYS